MKRWIPDPFVLALTLTLTVMLAGVSLMVAHGSGVGAALWDVLMGWIKGAPITPKKRLGGMTHPGGLAFALQMSLVLVTGHALAEPPVVP